MARKMLTRVPTQENPRVPAKAGIHSSAREKVEEWVPACAGT